MPQITAVDPRVSRNARTHAGHGPSSSSRSPATILQRGAGRARPRRSTAPLSRGRLQVGWEMWLPSFQVTKSLTNGYVVRNPSTWVRNARRSALGVVPGGPGDVERDQRATFARWRRPPASIGRLAGVLERVPAHDDTSCTTFSASKTSSAGAAGTARTGRPAERPPRRGRDEGSAATSGATRGRMRMFNLPGGRCLRGSTPGAAAEQDQRFVPCCPAGAAFPGAITNRVARTDRRVPRQPSA